MPVSAPATALVTATPDPALLRLAGVCDTGTFKPLRSNVGDGLPAGSGRVAGRPVYVWAQQLSHMGDRSAPTAAARSPGSSAWPPGRAPP